MTPAGMRIAIEDGIFPGPRLLVSVNIVSQTGGHGDWTLASGLDPAWITSDLPRGIADSPDEMRKVVRTMIRAGADWIKLCTTGGVLSPLDPPDTPQFTVEEIGVAVAEARAARLGGVMAHAIGAEGIRNALNAGVRSIEHGYMIDEEGIALLTETGAYLVPTLHALRSVRERADATRVRCRRGGWPSSTPSRPRSRPRCRRRSGPGSRSRWAPTAAWASTARTPARSDCSSRPG